MEDPNLDGDKAQAIQKITDENELVERGYEIEGPVMAEEERQSIGDRQQWPAGGQQSPLVDGVSDDDTGV